MARPCIRRHDRPSPARNASGLAWVVARLCLGLAVAPWVPTAYAADLQFDVFLGYGGQPTGFGGIVHDIGWSTVACEVHNPGPSFNATFEISPANLGTSQTQRLMLELPANTRKRFVIPLFMGGFQTTWNARLLDDRGNVRAELENLQSQTVAWEGLLLGALPRTFAGLPNLPPTTRDSLRTSQNAAVARLIPELLPDNPLGFEGLDALYLNSDRAADLSTGQSTALVQWLFHGGHLIVALEDTAGLESADWLAAILPFAPGPSRAVPANTAIATWAVPLTNTASSTLARANSYAATGQSSRHVRYNPAALFAPMPPNIAPPETSLTNEEIGVVTGRATAGHVLLSAEGVPLVVRAKRGRGTITVLTFSPEREPVRSWTQRDWFWARVVQMPPEWFGPGVPDTFDRVALDGLFGVLLDSRHIRTIPLGWLFLLLAVYLAVIGPIDRLVLQRLRREMLTWITFPASVILFSLLIYYVGFQLRAGDIEWNELHLVDLLPAEITSSSRGRTYASMYSPVTARYPLANTIPNATLRGELLGYAQPGGDIALTHRGNGFDGEVAVAVWTSQMLVSDWLATNPPPFSATLTGPAGARRIQVRNHLSEPLRELRLAMEGRIHELGDLPPHGTTDLLLADLPVRALREFAFQHTSSLVTSAQQRQYAFGSGNQGWPLPNPAVTTALSFTAHPAGQGPRPTPLTAPRDFDCSPLIDRGDAVLLAWVSDYAPVPTMRQFDSPRSSRNTLFRLALPLDSDTSPDP